MPPKRTAKRVGGGRPALDQHGFAPPPESTATLRLKFRTSFWRYINIVNRAAGCEIAQDRNHRNVECPVF
jgi:hypothetical protein